MLEITLGIASLSISLLVFTRKYAFSGAKIVFLFSFYRGGGRVVIGKTTNVAYLCGKLFGVVH